MRARVLAIAALVALGLLATPAQALEVDPEAPVVVDDAVLLWPGESRFVDVVANDTDPGGDDLAVCRVSAPEGPHDSVYAFDAGMFSGDLTGTLSVQASSRARGEHVLDYYVCNHTHLTPARLTVTIREVQPVDVVPAAEPDRILVTNHNERRITFITINPRNCDLEAIRRVGAGATATVRVHFPRVPWVALIGNSGIADQGTVRGVEMSEPPKQSGPKNVSCSVSFGRQLPGIGASVVGRARVDERRHVEVPD